MSEEGRPRRPHTGRRRNDAARQAVLDVTLDLMRSGNADVTIDAIARAAGVGRQTIYRWWPSKGAVAAEALASHARATVPVSDTGSLTADLTAFLAASFVSLRDDRTRSLLRRMMAAAQADEHVAATLADFTAARRATLRELLSRGQARGELPGGADLEMLTDMAYGVLWYRVLVGHAPLDDQAAKSLATCLVAAGAAGAR
ncbi:MAG: TetR/AcrR family transcriptional regulator [Nocardiopsaceae bacterium]|nr:TetR/AcrR family transcriptional regulator [Nocardiopsaceae bacterium]